MSARLLWMALLLTLGFGCVSEPGKEQEGEASPLPAISEGRTLFPPAEVEYAMVEEPDPSTGRFIRADSYLRRWRGMPIPVSASERDPDALLRREFLPEEGSVNGVDPIGAEEWRAFRFSGFDLNSGNLAELFPSFRVVFLVAGLVCDRELEGLKLYVSGTGNLRVWVNGELVCHYDRPSGELSRQEEIGAIRLRRGENRIVVKSVRVSADWRFRLWFADADGRPLRLKYGKSGEKL